MKEKEWYKLDNIGVYYAPLRHKKRQIIFRYTASLKDNIDEKILLEALKDTIKVFPNFHINLKYGFFWYYLEESSKDITVSKEHEPILNKLIYDEDDLLYRVTYYKKRINFECSHILSDGRGSLEFFKILISFYIKYYYKLSISIDTNSSSIDRTEDSFDKYFKHSNGYKNSHKNIYHYKGIILNNKTRYMEIHLNTDKVLNLAHKYNASMTELLVAILIYSIIKEMNKRDYNKLIKIDIPVDLRTFNNSESSKNYFGLASIDFRPIKGNINFEDIIMVVKNEFKERINIEKLEERVNTMVNYQKLIAARVIPLFIKDIFMIITDKFTSKMHTTTLSNIGKVKFSDEIDKYIESLSVLTTTEGFQFTIISNKNDLCIGISSIYKYNNIIRNFAIFFKENNIDEEIYTEVC